MIVTSTQNKSTKEMLENKLNELSTEFSKLRSCNYELFLTATKMLEHIGDRRIKDKFIEQLAEIKFEKYK